MPKCNHSLNASSSRGVKVRRGQDKRRSRTNVLQHEETVYPPWWSFRALINWFRNLPDNTLWNSYIAIIVFLAVLFKVSHYRFKHLGSFDMIYNLSYLLHGFAIGYRFFKEMSGSSAIIWDFVGLVLDVFTFTHYITNSYYWQLGCYHVRLHRPFEYLWSTTSYNFKGSILGTTLAYCYIFIVLRTTWAWIWMKITEYQTEFEVLPRYRTSVKLMIAEENPTSLFILSLYIVNKMFIPIGMPTNPINDVERLASLMVMLSGCIVVTGAAVASLSLVISLYMCPEETFNSRYKLIIKDMKDAQVPLGLRQKVQKFYRMYWDKQRAVSATKLLPTFPPTLPATIYTEIYFEATQKSRILRDLSGQFLSELAKKVETIYYIPGDVIIERKAKKSAIIFITYGDIEILTAEDDITPILRFTRGTILAPYGGAVAVAASRSYVTVRAATFCTAHVLHAADLWRSVLKYSVYQNHGVPIMAAFNNHMRQVKRHYVMKIPVVNTKLSSVLHFNRNLLALKEMKDASGNSLIANRDLLLEIAGCYNMRNRLDSTLTDESDPICLRQTFPCVFQPGSSLLLTWHSFVAAVIVWIILTYPYVLVFHKTVDIRFRMIDYLISALFIADHLVHLSTGAQVEEGVPITFSQTSSQQMRRKWFILDVMGTVPLFEMIGTGRYAGLNKILRLPKVFKVLKAIEEKCVYYRNLLRFCMFLFLMVVACYLVAAMQQTFMEFQFGGYCVVTNFTHSPYWKKSEENKESVSPSVCFTLYWAISMITNTCHIETWTKEDLSNVVYTMIILEFCIILRTFMEGFYSATIMVTTALSEEFDSRIATVRYFLISNEVDPELRKRFITYLQLCWYTDKAYKITHKEISSIFYDLPPHVYQDIVGSRRIKYMMSIPIMKMLKTEELKYLAANARLFFTPPNEILMNTGDLVNEIYVVVKGFCEVVCPVTHQTKWHLTANDHFGSVVCLLRLPSYYTVRAITHVQIFSVSKRHLKSLFDNPQIKEAIEYLKTLPVYTRLQQSQPSFLKYMPPPPTPNTERFILPRKHEADYEYLHPFRSLGFLSILRYIFPRFTIRPDGKYLIRYEWLRVSCAMISAILFPNYTYLVLQWPSLYYVTLLLDMTAMFDIFQRMLVAYYNHDGILVYHPATTAANYLKGSFFMDLFGCLPLEKLQSAHVDFVATRYHVTRVKQLLMMNRLLQLYRFPSIMQVVRNHIVRRDIQMVISALPIMLAIFNFMTSMMIFSSVKIYFFKNDEGLNDWLLVPFKDPGGSWIDIFHSTFRFNLTSSPWNLYVATHFWVVYETTTTGYAKLKPSNENLLCILIMGMVACGMLITYFTVRIISVRANVNKAHAGFQQHMRDITLFMKKEKLDFKLQNELRQYYEYNWEKMGGIDYRSVLKLCDLITLRTDAILHIYGPTFAKCPLLAECDVALLRQIGRSVRSVYFLRDMKIVESDDVVKDVYFVDYGGVESRVPVGNLTQAVRLPRGSLFGNLEGTPAQRVPMTIVATSRLHLLMINSQAFYQIINEFPTTKSLMEIFRMTDNQFYILGNIEDFKVKLSRDQKQAPPATTYRRDIIKYIYFQNDLVVLYLILVSLTCMFMDMYNAGYQDNQYYLIITLYILDMCFFLKILMQFSLPLFVTSRNLKALLLPLRRMYFQSEFKYDMMSCVPIEFLSMLSMDHRWLWFSWLRLNRMFRIVTVNNCLKHRSERIKVNLMMSTILTVTVWFCVFVHATTCLWYFIGMLEEQRQPKSSWLFTDAGLSWCKNEYICSLYFVITTFTQNGVGDIMPKKQSEVIFVTILMIISTLVFMTYVGEFSKLLQYQSFRSFSFYSQYLELQEFMKNNRVSENLAVFVKKYTLYLWRSSRGMQVPYFLRKAPLSLRLRVMSAAYMHHMQSSDIFNTCEQAFLRQLVGCLRLYHYSENMYVVKESEITNCLYIVHTGHVQEKIEETLESSQPRMFLKGSFFGVGLMRGTPFTHSYQIMNKSEVLTLHLDDWEYLLAHFPASRARIYKYMGDIDERRVNRSQWPGSPDQESPIYSELNLTGRETNLPKIFPLNKRHMTEAGPSGRYSREDSMDTVYSCMSKSISKSSLSRPSNSSTSTVRAKSDSVNIPELQDVKEFSRVGKMEKLTKILKKLMGRYSDMDVNETEEAEATQMVLKQLDRAKRLIETEKKNRHKYSKKSSSSLEDAEKCNFSPDFWMEGGSESLINVSEKIAIREVHSKLSETIEGPKVTPSLHDIFKSDLSSQWKINKKQGLDKDISSTDSQTKKEHQNAPSWGTRVVQKTDADIEEIPDTQTPVNITGPEDAVTQTVLKVANAQVNTNEETGSGVNNMSSNNQPLQEVDADIGDLPKDQPTRTQTNDPIKSQYTPSTSKETGSVQKDTYRNVNQKTATPGSSTDPSTVEKIFYSKSEPPTRQTSRANVKAKTPSAIQPATPSTSKETSSVQKLETPSTSKGTRGDQKDKTKKGKDSNDSSSDD